MSTTETSIEAGSLSQPTQPQTSLRSVAVVTTLTGCQLLLQFATQLVLAKYFGAAAEMDAYVSALAPPVVIATILAGSLAYVLVPIVAQLRAAGDEGRAAAVVSQLGIWLAAISIAVTSIVAVAAEPLVAFLCPGFGADERQMTATLIRILSPLILANTLIAYLNAVFHAYRRFAAPALAGVVGTIITLAYVLLLHEHQGINAVGWGVVAGAATTVALLLPFFFKTFVRGREGAVSAQPHFSRAVKLLLPLFIASLFWRLDPLLDRYLGSQLATGSLAHMGYAWRIINALMLIGTSGLSVVAFPAIAAHAAANRRHELSAELAHAIRFFVYLMVPVCVGLAAFAQPVVSMLFEHGRFTTADATAVALLVALYVGAIFGAGLGDLLSRTFYAQHNTLAPVAVCAIVFALSAALKFVLVGPYAAAGLVAATSAYYALNAGVLLVILLARLGPDMLAGTLREFGRAAIGTLAACLVAGVVVRLPVPAAVLAAAAIAATTYVAVTWLMGDPFSQKLLRQLLIYSGVRD
ncbi:MAG TPA: lipid II flippase MurJ [Pirellulaceae bacterium]